MNKLRRIFALAGVVILVGMYLAVLILGLTASPATQGALMAAIGCTIVFPCLLYGMMLISRLAGGHNEPDETTKKNETTKKQEKK